MNKVMSIVLAAGEGTRMKSEKPKCLHTLCGKPMLSWVLDSLSGIITEKTCVVVGHKADEIKEYYKDSIEYAVQNSRLGSGHAVMCASDYLDANSGKVIIIAGDMPLIKRETLANLIEQSRGYSAAIATAKMKNPAGYGRVVRDENGFVIKIAEDEKNTPEQIKAIDEVNISIYCFDIKALNDALQRVKPVNEKGEYYLTDAIEVISGDGEKVLGVCVTENSEGFGVNDFYQLSLAEKHLRKRINIAHMQNGVRFTDPDNTYIDADIQIGRGTLIYPGVILEGETIVGKNCTLFQGSRLLNTIIGENTTVQNSVLTDSTVEDNTNIGPYAYLRPHSHIGSNCKIGDFVEIKNATVSNGAKIPHLSYVGDGFVGEKTNIACGAVFVNYDGKRKHKTIIEDNCFIGCNVNLVAPVKVGSRSYVAAGSTVTEDVPDNSLCIARSRQTVKRDWVNIKDRD